MRPAYPRASSALLAGLAVAGTLVATEAAAAEPSGVNIAKRSLEAFYYPGIDARFRVSMVLVNARGGERRRELTMLRKNIGKSGDQRYFMYFRSPADVKDTTFLVWKYPTRDDDRWIFIPALKLVRRVAASDKRSSFVGSDFTYEDVSGRDVRDEKHTLLRTENLRGRRCYVVESKPVGKAEYSRRVAWTDSERWLPLKEEYYDARGELMRVFSADRVEQVGDQWTIMKRTMRDTKRGQRTEVTFEDVAYNLGLRDDLFTERYLREPPPDVRR